MIIGYFFSLYISPNLGRAFIRLIFMINPIKNEIRTNLTDLLLDLGKVLFYFSVHLVAFQ